MEVHPVIHQNLDAFAGGEFKVEAPVLSVVEFEDLSSEPAVTHIKPTRDEVDWDTLKRTEQSVQQDSCHPPVDANYLRQRLQSMSCISSRRKVSSLL